MSSRGSFAKNGHVTTIEYKTIFKNETLNMEILQGTSKQFHTLPDYSHSPNMVYVKLKDDEVTLHEMRFYDSNCNPIIEIAYHPEPKINNGDMRTNILHYHIYKGLIRGNAIRMDEHPEMSVKYADYLKEFDLYD